MSQIVGVRALAKPYGQDPAHEQALLDRAKNQDFEAFGRLVDSYQSRVLGYIRRMVRNEDEARDVAQEVFIKAFQAMQGFDGRTSLRSWLFRIAHNLCIDRARKVKRQPLTYSLEPTDDGDFTYEVSDARWDPESAIVTGELRSVVEEAVETMSDKLRTVLLLHDKEEMGYEEIALTIDIPVGTVKSRLFLARAHVQRHVGAYLKGDTQ